MKTAGIEKGRTVQLGDVYICLDHHSHMCGETFRVVGFNMSQKFCPVTCQWRDGTECHIDLIDNGNGLCVRVLPDDGGQD